MTGNTRKLANYAKRFFLSSRLSAFGRDANCNNPSPCRPWLYAGKSLWYPLLGVTANCSLGTGNYIFANNGSVVVNNGNFNFSCYKNFSTFNASDNVDKLDNQQGSPDNCNKVVYKPVNLNFNLPSDNFIPNSDALKYWIAGFF